MDLDDIDEIIKKIKELGSEAYAEENEDGEIIIHTGLARDDDSGDYSLIDAYETEADYDDEDDLEDED
jgi:hypothetical protein